MSPLQALQTKLAAAKTDAATFGRKDDGSVAMIFGLAILPFCMMVALSVDYGRAVHQNQKFASALDSATVAAAKLLKESSYTDDDIRARALSFFKVNVQGSYATYNDDEFKVAVDRDNSRVDITLPVSVPTTFARIGGFDKMNIPQTATAVFAVRDIEVGLALDVTRSMEGHVGGTKKIDSLKSSFAKFADLMLPTTPVAGQKVRIGLAPYSSGVKLGAFASVASGGASTDGCVTERNANASKYTDMAPGGLNVFRVKEDGTTDIDPAGTLRNTYSCPPATLMPMTSDRETLISSVNSYETLGSTAGHMGAQWAWNLISPEWKDVWGTDKAGVAYGDKKTIKAVILMTDGQFNTAFNNRATSAEQAIETCKNMKLKGVQVFTLGFGLGNSAEERDAKATLQACATPGPDYFVDAANETELDAAFAKFAGKINALRISN